MQNYNVLVIMFSLKFSGFFFFFFFFLVIMGGSIFFFVESKTFEFLVEEGGTYFMLRIYERNKDSLRWV